MSLNAKAKAWVPGGGAAAVPVVGTLHIMFIETTASDYILLITAPTNCGKSTNQSQYNGSKSTTNANE